MSTVTSHRVMRFVQATVEGLFGKATRTPGIVAISALCFCLQGSTAWGSERALRDFHHVAWTLENGLGAVFDIQQGPDGNLWLTTAKGVFRFDGVRFQSVDEGTNRAVHNRDIATAFMSHDGALFLSPRQAPEGVSLEARPPNEVSRSPVHAGR